MTRFSARARKYLMALGGIGMLVGLRYLEVEIPGLPQWVMEVLVGLAVSEGVYQTPNNIIRRVESQPIDISGDDA
jgi:xanthosine utilization system XapX-like protein